MTQEPAAQNQVKQNQPGQVGTPTDRVTGLRPQKRLFVILCVVMAVWIGGLVTMYFSTVYPQRHSPVVKPHESDVDDHRPTTMNG